MNFIFSVGISLLLACFYLLVMCKCISAFFPQSSEPLYGYIFLGFYYLFQIILHTRSVYLPAQIVLTLNILFVFAISSTFYYGSLKKRCVLSMLICTVWMLVEISIGIVLGLFGLTGFAIQVAGSVMSQMCMFVFAVIGNHYVQRKTSNDISLRYVLAMLLIPAASIYLMHNIFLIANHYKKYSTFAIISSLLLLLVNYVIFEVYDRMTQNVGIMEKILLYEQQLELCGQQIVERESYNLGIRKLRHDIKEHMTSLLGMVQGNDTDAAEVYIKELLRKSMDCNTNDISRTGNIVVDSLINYKYALARTEGIAFDANIFLPASLPFQNGHITIILGNLLENALDACRAIKNRKRFIKLNASYTKEILTLTVCNPYEGKRRRNHEGLFLTTKENAESHGLGLSSVEQAVESYHGQIVAESNDGIFQVTVILYGHNMQRLQGK